MTTEELTTINDLIAQLYTLYQTDPSIVGRVEYFTERLNQFLTDVLVVEKENK